MEKKKPEIRFKGFEGAWEKIELGSISTMVARKSPADSSAPVMMITASSGFINQSARYSTDNAGSSLANYTLLFKGEMAYNHGYSKLRNYGSCFDLKEKEARVPFVYHTFALPYDSSSFFSLYLNSGAFDGELRKLVSSTARMDGLLNISYSTFMTLEVGRPSVSEQEKIGAFLTTLDKLIAKLEAKLDKLRKLKQALLERMFINVNGGGYEAPEIRFKGYTDKWEVKELREVATKIVAKNRAKQYSIVLTNSAEHGIISQREFFEHSIANANNIEGYYIVEPDDFVYNPRISTSAPVGPINRNKLFKSGVISPLYYVFRFERGVVNLSYLEYFFKASHWHSFMHKNGNSGARSDRFSISDELFSQLPLNLPKELEEQKSIGGILLQLDTHFSKTSTKLTKLRRIKQSLLEKMFV